MKIQTGYPGPPSYLTTAEKRLFNRLMRGFEPKHWSSGDALLMAQYVRYNSRFEEAEEHLKQEGSVIRGAKGNARSPWVQISQDSSKLMATLATRMRLTPQSRIRAENASRSKDRAEAAKVFNPNGDWRDYQRKN